MNKGFTLFEVLIALAVIAIAMTAVMRASASAAESAFELKQRLLAGWVAQNRMAELTAFQIWPIAGVLNGHETQDGMDFSWREEITDTPNPLFKKVVVHVSAGQISSELTGYLTRPMP